MVFTGILQRFVKEKPICVMTRLVLENQFAAGRLDAIFNRTAEHQYTRDLLFSTCAKLLVQVTLCGQPSVYAVFKRDREQVPTSVVAVYDKLKRVEPEVCEALVAETARPIATVLTKLNARRKEPIPNYRTRILDGNVLAGTEHRLLELRASGAAALPGMTLAFYDYATSLISALVTCEDGHANERRLLARVLQKIEPGDLVVGDRNFTTREFMEGIPNRQATFLIRAHGVFKLRPLSRRRYVGKCCTGAVYEQHVRMTWRQECRLIIIERSKPMRSGGRRVTLLTNVPSKHAPATKLANLYLDRWKIEESFRQLTQYLSCEVKTLGYPKAALLAFSLAVMAYNCLACVHGALASIHGRKKVDEELSAYYVALEVKTTFEGMMVAIPGKQWRRFGQVDANKLATLLRHIARNVRWERYTKAPRGPKKLVRRKKVPRGYHVSTASVLEGRKKIKNHKSLASP
jgi:hypothetical protein